jgi:cytidyltransferase-like protein
MTKQLKNYLRVGILTGGFDPVTPGHIDYFRSASKLVDKLIVCVNSDEWLTRKKGKPFMKQEDRIYILSSIRYIDAVFGIDDIDDKDNTSCEAIKKIRHIHQDDELFFINGGDRTQENIPETNVADEYNVHLLFGVGGTEKKYSSSWYLKNWVE